MINWVIGGVIVSVTVFIVVRTIVRMRKGGSSCCGNCTQSKSDCCKITSRTSEEMNLTIPAKGGIR